MSKVSERHPPSPTSFPIVGSLFSIPPGMAHIAYMKLGKQLKSDIISLKLFGYDFVVLNSFRAAADTLDKRSSIYSDRLSMPMVQDPTLFNWGNQSALLGYGDLWRSHRRMLNNWLNARAVTQFHPIQEQHIQPLLRQLVRLVDDPQPFEKVKHSIFINAASSVLKLAYGYTLQEDNDKIFEMIHHTNKHLLMAGTFTNFLVNVLPPLSYVPHWFPGAGWKRTAYRWRILKEQALSIPYEWTKAQIASGTAEPSILSTLLQNLTLTSHMKEDERENLKEVAHVIVAAGTDTTSTALVAFVAAMVLNPDVQLKAQKELDTVLGPTSLPTMSDRERLPYMRKLIQEVLRWQPVAPTGVQPFIVSKRCKIISHENGYASQLFLMHAGKMNYEGYDIRKGTVVIGNVWAITRDEKIYKDPEAFDPDRFQDPTVPYAPAFEASIHYDSITACYVYVLKEERTGWREIIPDIENISNAIVMELKPFEFELKLRSPPTDN
ncbi:cytochrome P450 family protein [Rhizoctonia solani]|uniref:Cytochrome P450 family protein n=1 Tax=Rhizoctonia solani TaxID=456999 RepID=A0A8H8P4V0_9AGAM|nr:cytochrome P450 family protein [Rhizoctonia solani]QRW23946.1 cytochrome P450 family protein [Rhizoctonia solani]